MSRKRIIYTTAEGTLTVVIPAPNFMKKFLSEQEGLEAIRKKSVPPDATDVKIVDISELPTDRTFRDAWESTPNGVQVNLEKAKKIRAEQLRYEEELKKKKIERETRKVEIRNFDIIKNAITLDELKNIKLEDI